MTEWQTCQGCGKEIDPDVCWCGDELGKHTGYEGHSPVPMGCECGFVDGDDWMGGREALVRE